MKRVTKIMAMVVLIIMSLGIFVGCGGNKYNAVVLNDGYTFKPEFLKDSMTYGAYDEDLGDYLLDQTIPKARIFIIKDNKELDKIFSDFQQLDFNNEMVILYVFTSIYGRQRNIQKMEVTGNLMTVTLKMTAPQGKDASIPQRRFIVIKLNSLNIGGVEIIEK